MDSRPAIALTLRGRGQRRFDLSEKLLVSRHGERVPGLLRADAIRVGDFVGITYGGTWPTCETPLPELAPRKRYGSEKRITLPRVMTQDLALFLGAYLSEGHTTRSSWSVVITNSVPEVLERVRAAAEAIFDIPGRINQPQNRCANLVLTSKRLVEFLDLLECGSRASNKQVPYVMNTASREHVLTFLRGVALDAYTSNHSGGKWAICLESMAAIAELQDLLTKLGIANAQVPKLNRVNARRTTCSMPPVPGDNRSAG